MLSRCLLFPSSGLGRRCKRFTTKGLCCSKGAHPSPASTYRVIRIKPEDVPLDFTTTAPMLRMVHAPTGLCFLGQDPSAGKHQEEELPTPQLEEERSHSTILQNRGTSVPSPPAQPRCSSLHPTTPPRTAPAPQLHTSFRSSKPPGPTRKRAGAQRTQEEKQRINSSPFLLFFSGGVWRMLRRTTTNPRSKTSPQYGSRDALSTRTAAAGHWGASQGCSCSRGSGEVRGQEGARWAGLLRGGGGSPREIGPHQFPLITQPLCYVGLVAKSVGA